MCIIRACTASPHASRLSERIANIVPFISVVVTLDTSTFFHCSPPSSCVSHKKQSPLKLKLFFPLNGVQSGKCFCLGRGWIIF